MKSWCLAGLMVAMTLAGGCTEDYIPVIDPKPTTGNITTEVSAPKTVDLTASKAWYWNNEVTVMGSAKSNALSGDKSNISGFIDVEVIDKNKTVIDSAMASLMPNTLSTDHPSEYKVSIWTKHPEVVHLKLVFIDQRDESAYLGNTSSGGGAGSASQSGNYSRPSGGANSGFNNFGHGISGVNDFMGTSGVNGVASSTGGVR